MHKITCRLPNASTEISGVPFVLQEDGSVVAETDDAAVVATFTGIPGYEVEDLSPKDETTERGRRRGKGGQKIDDVQDEAATA